MKKLVIFTEKNLSSLDCSNGHSMRIINLIKYHDKFMFTNDISKLTRDNHVVDIPCLGVRRYIRLCFKSGFLIKNVFMQDSSAKYFITKLLHAVKYKRWDLLKFMLIANIVRCTLREAIIYLLCKKIGFVNESDSLFSRKAIISKNGISMFRPLLKESKCRRLVFWGNLNYEPNIQSLFSLIRSNIQFFEENPIHLYGQISNENVKFLKKLNCTRPTFFVYGKFDSLPDIINSNDVFINCVDFGSGIKNKTIESIGLGIWQISTSHALDGVSKNLSTVKLYDHPSEIPGILLSLGDKPSDENITSDVDSVNFLTWDNAAKNYMRFIDE